MITGKCLRSQRVGRFFSDQRLRVQWDSGYSIGADANRAYGSRSGSARRNVSDRRAHSGAGEIEPCTGLGAQQVRP